MSQPDPVAINKTEARLEELATGFSGELAVCAAPLDAEGEPTALISRNAEMRFAPASTIKLPILAEVLHQCERGRLALDQRVRLKDDDKVSGSGILNDLGSGLEPTVLDLAVLMIIISDNTATNMLIDLAGREAINETTARLGMTDTYLAGKLQLPPERYNEEQKAGRRSESTPADMLRYVLRAHAGKLISPWVSNQALAIMRRQQLIDSLTRYLPHGAQNGYSLVDVAAKSGSINGVRHQVAIIKGAERTGFAAAIFTKGCKDLRWCVDNEGEVLIAKVSAELYALFG